MKNIYLFILTLGMGSLFGNSVDRLEVSIEEMKPRLPEEPCLYFNTEEERREYFAQQNVRSITPPVLSEAYLGERIIGYRPMRRGSPRIEVEQRGEQLIVHNYGHGGSGWTLAPGVTEYANSLLFQSPLGAGIEKDTPLVVVGGGVIGLFTAYDLHQRGYVDITVVAEAFDGLVSHQAGGLLAPVSMDNDPELGKIIEVIGIDAYRFYDEISQGKHKDFAEGAVKVPTYFETRQASGLDAYVEAGVMNPAVDVMLDFGNGTRRQMVEYGDGIFIDTASMMEQLHVYLNKVGVHFKQMKVERLEEINSRVVFNCSGMSGKYLNNDPEMVSVQGHLIMLKEQIPENLKYMVLTYGDKFVNEHGQRVARSFYIFPKRMPGGSYGVIGGTFIEGADGSTPNDKDFESVLQGAKAFYGME